MRRTTTRRRRAIAEFIADNRRLFPLMGLFLSGVLVGVIVYVTVGSHITDDWGSLVRVTGLTGGLRTGLSALWNCCFGSLVLLLLLFLLGLWSCGAPFALTVPLFYGMSLGLTEAYYYSIGGAGVTAVAAVIMPVGLLNGVVLIMACVESLRLSVRLSRQLLPATVGADIPREGLWPEFRLYCLRFLLFLTAAVAVGLVQVLLRTVFAGLLP